MIRIMIVTPKMDALVDKQRFLEGKNYQTYVKDGKSIVYNNGQGVAFENHIWGHFRSQLPDFNEHFNVIYDGHVKNKKELKHYLKSESFKTT